MTEKSEQFIESLVASAAPITKDYPYAAAMIRQAAKDLVRSAEKARRQRKLAADRIRELELEVARLTTLLDLRDLGAGERAAEQDRQVP